MGRCYAMQLAEMGYGIVLIDINGDGAQELSLLLTRQYGTPAHVLCLDLTRSDAAEQVVDFCRHNGCQVEILINNAGMLMTGSIEETDLVMLQRIIALHCTTPLLLCRQLLPLMKEQGRGYILNVSSVSAWMDWPFIGMYGCTKRFVKGYSRALRIECMGTSVSVTTAIFGAVDTPLLNSLSLRFRKLMLHCGFMISPEKAVRCALRAMFRRRSSMIPCLSDRLVIMLCPLLPNVLLHALWKRFADKL